MRARSRLRQLNEGKIYRKFERAYCAVDCQKIIRKLLSLNTYCMFDSNKNQPKSEPKDRI